MSNIEQIIEGLKIFAKYSGDVSAEHDVIYAGPSMKSTSWISKEESDQLLKLNWGPNSGDSNFDNTPGTWYKFV